MTVLEKNRCEFPKRFINHLRQLLIMKSPNTTLFGKGIITFSKAPSNKEKMQCWVAEQTLPFIMYIHPRLPHNLID